MSCTTQKISVIVPAYNAGEYVCDALQSLCRQTYEHLEILILDDGSTDITPQVVGALSANDNRIRWWRRENGGYVTALNELLGEARGEFIARMDADDVALPNRFEKQIRYLNEHPECVCVGSRVQTIGPVDEPIDYRVGVFDHDAIDQALLRADAFAIVHPSCVFRADAVREVGGYDEALTIAEDIDLYLKLAEIGRLANLKDVLLKYRLHAKSVTHTQLANSHRLTWQVINAARQRRGCDSTVPPPYHSKKSIPQQRWGWWALKAGNKRSARKFAGQNVSRRPFSTAAWKLLLCACRGR